MKNRKWFIFIIIVQVQLSCHKGKISDLSGFWIVSQYQANNDKNIGMTGKVIYDVCFGYQCFYFDKISDSKYIIKTATDDNGNWRLDNKYALDALFDKKHQTLTINNSQCIAFSQPIAFSIMRNGDDYSMSTKFTIYAYYGNPTISPPFGPDSIHVSQTWTKLK